MEFRETHLPVVKKPLFFFGTELMRLLIPPRRWHEAATQCDCNSVGLHLSQICRLWLKTCRQHGYSVSSGLESRFQPSLWSPLMPLRFVCRSPLHPWQVLVAQRAKTSRERGVELGALGLLMSSAWALAPVRSPVGNYQEWAEPSRIIQGFSLRHL